MLEVCYSSIQILNSKYSRQLITMKKTVPYDQLSVDEFHARQGLPGMKVDNIHNVVMTKPREDNRAEAHARIPRLRGKNF